MEGHLSCLPSAQCSHCCRLDVSQQKDPETLDSNTDCLLSTNAQLYGLMVVLFRPAGCLVVKRQQYVPAGRASAAARAEPDLGWTGSDRVRGHRLSDGANSRGRSRATFSGQSSTFSLPFVDLWGKVSERFSIKAHPHQRLTGFILNHQMNLVWIRPQEPFFCFLNELGDKLSFKCEWPHWQQYIGSIHGQIHQFMWIIRSPIRLQCGCA